MCMVKVLNEIKEPKVSELGGKGYSLVVLIRNGFNVPIGFVIASEMFFKFLNDNNLIERIQKLGSEINENNFQEKSKEIKNLILNGKMPGEIISKIEENLNKLNVQYVSIRSSAVSEDSLKASFAGLHDTFLNIKAEPNLVSENVKKCLASLFNERAVIYRIKKRIPHLEGMAVIVQEMIPAEISGITFTVHPTDEKSLLLDASYGIGDMIVSGKVEPDDYTVDRETLEIIDKKIGRKDKMGVVESGSAKVVNVEKELAEKQVLADEKIKEIAKTCIEVGGIFNHPQDIEWCILDNKLWLLQSRAIIIAFWNRKIVEANNMLKGVPASPGMLKGKVIVIRDESNEHNSNIGSLTILVIKIPDPLYTPLILAAGAVVAEYGSTGAHAALICREIGKPCIVQVEDACDILSGWSSAIINGSTGIIAKAEGENEY